MNATKITSQIRAGAETVFGALAVVLRSPAGPVILGAALTHLLESARTRRQRAHREVEASNP